MPITALSGVRISWLMLARNSDLAWVAARLGARASCSSRPMLSRSSMSRSMASAMLLKVVRRVWISCTSSSPVRRTSYWPRASWSVTAHMSSMGRSTFWRTLRTPRRASSTVAVMPMMAATIQLRRRWRASVTWLPVRRSTCSLSAAMAMALRARCTL
jgi:hypothetical protein